MGTNPYSSTFTDECSDQEFPDPRYIAWQEGEIARGTEWVKAFKSLGIAIEQPQQLRRIIPCLKEDCWKAGIQEAVEWFFAHGYSGGPIRWEDLQAQLKKWGIEEKGESCLKNQNPI